MNEFLKTKNIALTSASNKENPFFFKKMVMLLLICFAITFSYSQSSIYISDSTGFHVFGDVKIVDVSPSFESANSKKQNPKIHLKGDVVVVNNASIAERNHSVNNSPKDRTSKKIAERLLKPKIDNGRTTKSKVKKPKINYVFIANSNGSHEANVKSINQQLAVAGISFSFNKKSLYSKREFLNLFNYKKYIIKIFSEEFSFRDSVLFGLQWVRPPPVTFS